MKKIIEEKGQNIPENGLPNPEEEIIAAASCHGKYVLVHFWSAVDQNSRIVNPVLAEVYQKYKNKGFEIYQVSVDKDRSRWLDAIEKDKLVWTNVGDMEGSIQPVMYYNIRSVPYNYLLDKEGAIVAQNLSGPAIERALSLVLR